MSSLWHLPFFILLLMMALCGAQGRIKRKHTCITYFAKSKTGSTEKIKPYHQIKMCTGMAMVGMVRWILGPEWVLDITIHMWWELWVDGKVDTTPGMDTSYYHQNYGTPFCMISSLPYFSFILDMGYFSFLSLFFNHASSMYFSLFFSYPCLFLKDTSGERCHTTYGALFLWNG